MRANIDSHGAPASGSDTQVTARKYDDQGRLEKMAAVLPGHNNQAGADGWTIADVVWGASDGTLQV